MIENRRNRIRFANQHDSRAFLRMFLCGFSFREVARKHPGREDGLARDIRAELYDREAA
jgi:hypothetical protein